MTCSELGTFGCVREQVGSDAHVTIWTTTVTAKVDDRGRRSNISLQTNAHTEDVYTTPEIAAHNT